MDMDKIQVGKWYNFQKLDKTGNHLIIRSGKVVEKWNTMLRFVNMGGIYTCFYSQVLKEVGNDFICPICNKKTEITTINNVDYFSCGNVDCGNMKIYDVITLQSKTPKIIKIL